MVGRMLSRTCHLCRCSVLDQLPKCLPSSQRYISTSSVVWKKYQFAINKKAQIPGGNRAKELNKKHRKVISFEDGKVLSYFKFDNFDEGDTPLEESPKQKAYSEIVHHTVQVLLTSKESPQEIQDCTIEIVHIDISPSLLSANVLWKLPDYCESKYTKEETAALLEKYIDELRLLIPSYSMLTQTPTIRFIYDTSSDREKEINALFEIAKKEEEEYMKRNPSECEEPSN